MNKIITAVVLIAFSMQLFGSQNQINISHVDKTKLLQALFYHAKPEGGQLSGAEARNILEKNNGQVDDLQGKVLNVNLSGTVFSTRLFDHANGVGMARAAVLSIDLFGDITFTREKS